jgi:hypothetical protein
MIASIPTSERHISVAAAIEAEGDDSTIHLLPYRVASDADGLVAVFDRADIAGGIEPPSDMEIVATISSVTDDDIAAAQAAVERHAGSEFRPVRRG